MRHKRVIFLVQAAAIGAIYVVMTLLFAPFGFGEIQVRLAEALTILPYYTPAAIPGLFIGCLIGNIMGGAILPDIILRVLSAERPQIPGASSAYPDKYSNCSLCTVLRLRDQSAHPPDDADCGYRGVLVLRYSGVLSAGSLDEVQIPESVSLTETCCNNILDSSQN